MGYLFWRATVTPCLKHWVTPALYSRFPIGARPRSGVVPTAQEVAPWVAVIERLWDDANFEAEHVSRALVESKRWES